MGKKPLLGEVINIHAAFSHSRMNAAWKDTIRNGLRSQGVGDLHDYYDFHRHYRTLLGTVSQDIVRGEYRPRPAEVIRVEKGNGICRVMQLLAPEDAVVLQTIVEELEPRIKAVQPSANAFYSRTHEKGHKPPNIEDVDGTFAYPWRLLWPEFQTRIFKFAHSFPFTVVTDISNYYDNISFDQLRNCISGVAKFEERLIDFLMYVLEAFVWRPNYLPLSGVGLPQVDFDAPRLLAHAFLFKADRYLDRSTESNFVRWMDDIDFGVASVSEGRSILKGLDDVLHTKGVRLNSGKTRVLSMEEASKHFWIQENRQLTIFKNSIDQFANTPAVIEKVTELMTKRFKRFLRKPRGGNWDKVVKRYLGLFGKVKLRVAEPLVPELMRDYPSIRDACFRYYLSLGYSPERYHVIKSFLTSGECLDDVSWFGAAEVLVGWQLKPHSSIRRDIVKMASEGSSSEIGVLAGRIWLLAKYGSSSDLEGYIRRVRTHWAHSPFLSRQVAAVSPRLSDNAKVELRKRMSEAGLVDGLRVLDHLSEISESRSLDHGLRSYLFYTPATWFSYSLPKVLTALQLLQGNLDEGEALELRSRLLGITTDPDYRRLLATCKIRRSSAKRHQSLVLA